ncbi:MAG TPA: hypothetical protein VJZ93_03270 [Candidatus Nanoarchaeia archaeon]|nr:hypothetical protein [Candidatus Nanoarchaeia archaeon]
MRKITSKHDEEKKQRRTRLVLGFFLIFIMLFSTLGYAFSYISNQATQNTQTAETINYNGFQFTNQNGFWISSVNGNSFILRNNPNEVPEIISKLNGISSYKNKPLYIFSESIEAESEIRTNMAIFSERIQNACIEGASCEGNFPIKNCNDNLIIIKKGEQESVTQENNCVYIIGKQENLGKLADRFLLNIFGIN